MVIIVEKSHHKKDNWSMQIFAYSWAEIFGDAQSMKFPFISLSFNFLMIPVLSMDIATYSCSRVFTEIADCEADTWWVPYSLRELLCLLVRPCRSFFYCGERVLVSYLTSFLNPFVLWFFTDNYRIENKSIALSWQLSHFLWVGSCTVR